MRKTVSLTLVLSGLLVLVTSAVLYIEPHGRVAYWAGWRFLGLSKTGWDDIHLTTGTLFLAALVVHVYYNWKPITAYLRNTAREMVVFTRPFVFALLVTVFVTAGTLAGWTPMQQILDFGAHIKERQTRTWGNPPFGHAELAPLGKFAGFLGLSVDEAAAALQEAGYRVPSPEATVLEIAEANGVSPQALYDSVKDRGTVDLPEAPPPGTGKLPLADFAALYGLDPATLVAALDRAGIEHAPDMSLKQIAAANALETLDVYTVLRKAR